MFSPEVSNLRPDERWSGFFLLYNFAAGQNLNLSLDETSFQISTDLEFDPVQTQRCSSGAGSLQDTVTDHNQRQVRSEKYLMKNI